MDFEKQLQQLKILAGIYKPYLPEETQQENISYTGTEKSKLQKKHNIQPAQTNGLDFGLLSLI